jgi:cell division protein FtsZ
MPQRRDEGTVLRRERPQQSQADTRAAAQQLATRAKPEEASQRPARPPAEQPVPARKPAPAAAPAGSEPAASPPKQPRQVQFDDDDLDVPDFLK